MKTLNNEAKNDSQDGLKLKFLSPAQIRQIDEVLTQLGEYGEIHLIIQRGELRYINKVQSYRAWTTDEES